LTPPELDPKGAWLNDEEFKNFQIETEIKRKYFKVRNDLIRERYNEEEVAEERNEDEQDYFKSLQEDPRISKLQIELDIKGEKAPSFAEIYDDIDRLLANAPVTIKRSVEQSLASGNTTFNPLY
jgi:hypothetical protein